MPRRVRVWPRSPRPYGPEGRRRRRGAIDETQAVLEEAEVLARYGLKDRAVERLRALVKDHPELLSARERLVELLVDLHNPAAPREAEALAEVYRGQGRESLAVALFARISFSAESRRAESLPPPTARRPSTDVVFDEFEIELPASPARPSPTPADSIPLRARPRRPRCR